METQKQWLLGQFLSTKTKYKTLRCRCARGHVFKTEAAVSLNIKTDSAIAEELALTGLVITTCPACKIECQLAMPTFLLDPDNERVAFYIPNQISYMELYLRALLAEELLNKETDVPSYFADLELLLGSAALMEWHAKKAPKKSKTSDSKNPPKKDSSLKRSADRSASSPPLRPSIHEAFADLDRAEDIRSASIPPEADPEEPEDDWLDDHALARSKASSKQSKK